MPDVDPRTLLTQIEGESKAALDEAMAARNLQMIKAAISKARSVGVSPGDVAEAQALVAKIEKEEGATAALQAAISAKSSSALNSALKAAKGLGIKSNIIGEAEAVMKSLADQDAAWQRSRPPLSRPSSTRFRRHWRTRAGSASKAPMSPPPKKRWKRRRPASRALVNS